jgi:hypothetical protein
VTQKPVSARSTISLELAWIKSTILIAVPALELCLTFLMVARLSFLAVRRG